MNYRLIDHRRSILAATYLHDLYDMRNDTGYDETYCCLPNGALGITIILEGTSHVEIDGQWQLQPSASVYGLITRRQSIRMSGHYREVTIGFLPHHFQLLLRDRMTILLKHDATDLTLLFNKYEVEQLVNGLAASKSDDELLSHIDRFLQKQLQHHKTDERLIWAHDLIHNTSIYSVNALSQRLNLSTTRLRDLFNEMVGLTPKEMIKIARMKKALEHTMIEEGSLTKLAHMLQYFDQAHFIHDFRHAMDMSPKQYFKNKNLTYDFYNYARLRLSSFVNVR